ncbi:Transposon Ty3-G Gag-Pol polyprotein [Halotydeus destructor]|nr:Transposon Ty3-G Gag-Pol polyprotein [Halotydeus destructor]
MVDTGSNLTTISKQLADKLKLKYESLGQHEVHYADEKRRVELWSAKVRVDFLGQTKHVDIFVVPKSTEPLMGLDWLHAFKCEIDIDGRVLKSSVNNRSVELGSRTSASSANKFKIATELNLSNEKGRKDFIRISKLQFAKGKAEAEPTIKIKLAHDAMLKSNSRTFVEVRSSRIIQTEVLVTPADGLMLAKQIMCDNSIADSTLKYISLTNFSNEDVLLRSGQTVGYCSTIDEVLEPIIVSENNGHQIHSVNQRKVEVAVLDGSKLNIKWPIICSHHFVNVRSNSKPDDLSSYPKFFDEQDVLCRKIVTEVLNKGNKSKFEPYTKPHEFDPSSVNVNSKLDKHQKEELLKLLERYQYSFARKMKADNSRIQKWCLDLIDYRYKVKYKPGKEHVDADGISRMDHPEELSEEIENPVLTFKSEVKFDLKLEQSKDDYCKDLNRRLSKANVRKRQNIVRHFVIIHGILYRKARINLDNLVLPVIPLSMQSTYLEECHWSPEASHNGQARTFQRLREKCWWPAMKHDCTKFVQRCPHCQRKKTTRRSKPRLRPLINEIKLLGNRPFTMLGLDIIVLKDHPTFSKKNKYIIVCRDYNTRYLFTQATVNMETITILKFLSNQVFCIIGYPKVVITDRARQFTSDQFRDTLAQWGVEHRLTSGYRPQTNGLVERTNHTIKEMMSSMVSEGHKNWDIYLPIVTYAINTAKHEVTKFSPFYLVFGYVPRDPIDNRIGREDYFPATHFKELPDKTAERLQLARDLALQRLFNWAEKIELETEPKRLVPRFVEGEEVLKLQPIKPAGKVKGFWKPYDGPYRVVKMTHPNVYVIKRENEEEEYIVNVDNLKKYHSSEESRYFEYSKNRKKRFPFLQGRPPTKATPVQESDTLDELQSSFKLLYQVLGSTIENSIEADRTLQLDSGLYVASPAPITLKSCLHLPLESRYGAKSVRFTVSRVDVDLEPSSSSTVDQV